MKTSHTRSRNADSARFGGDYVSDAAHWTYAGGTGGCSGPVTAHQAGEPPVYEAARKMLPAARDVGESDEPEDYDRCIYVERHQAKPKKPIA